MSLSMGFVDVVAGWGIKEWGGDKMSMKRFWKDKMSEVYGGVSARRRGSFGVLGNEGNEGSE